MRNGTHVILYIDDDQDYLDAMREIVESDGYEMVEARSGEDFQVVTDRRLRHGKNVAELEHAK